MDPRDLECYHRSEPPLSVPGPCPLLDVGGSDKISARLYRASPKPLYVIRPMIPLPADAIRHPNDHLFSDLWQCNNSDGRVERSLRNTLKVEYPPSVGVRTMNVDDVDMRDYIKSV